MNVLTAIEGVTYRINKVDSEGQTKLHIAATNGDLQKALQLIQDKIELNLQDKNGWTALHCAAFSRNKHVFALLLEQDDIDVTLKVDQLKFF